MFGNKISKIEKLAAAQKGDRLVRYLGDKDAAVRHAAIKGLGVAGGEEAFNNLTALLRDPNPETRKAAAGALELLKDPKSVAFIDARLRVETDEGVKAALRKAQSAVNTGN